MVAIVAHAGFSAFSGIALAGDTANDPGIDWPFANFVICTSDGVETGNPAGDDQPVQRSAASQCDLCPSGCCGGVACDRMGVAIVLDQTWHQSAADWAAHSENLAEATVSADFSIRAPPFSA